MKKINIGAGVFWKYKDWESLDNVPGNYKDKKRKYNFGVNNLSKLFQTIRKNLWNDRYS